MIFDDYLESIKQMKNMGGLGNIMNMLPGLGGMGSKMKRIGRRADSGSREEDGKDGSNHSFHDTGGKSQSGYSFLHPESTELPKVQGVDISEVNRMIKQFNEMKKLMKQFGKPGKKKNSIPVLNMIYRGSRVI